MATCKNCGKTINDMLKDYGFCSYDCSSAYNNSSTTSPNSTSPASTAPSSTSPSTEPTTDPVTGLEVPRALTHDTYKGHKLSVKPGEVETVSLYLNKTLVDDLNAMAEKISESKTRVENKANEDPVVGVPGSYSTAYDNASKAIATALEDVQDAVTKLRNVADAICQYGDGGWATPYSVLKHLNDFIYSGGGPGAGPDGGPGDGGDGLDGDDILEPSEEETTIPDGVIGGTDNNDKLNNFDEEIVVSEIAGVTDSGNGNAVVPSVGEMAKVIYPFLVDTYNVFADAELLISRSTSNELAEVKKLSITAHTLANSIHTTSQIIKSSYGPIIDYDEIDTVLSEYVGKGFHITDYSKTIKDYEDEIGNLRIVEHKLSALVEKLEQGGCSVRRERSAHLQN